MKSEPFILNYFRFTKWLPTEATGNIHLDSDLTHWREHFRERGIRIKAVRFDGRVALYREGMEAK